MLNSIWKSANKLYHSRNDLRTHKAEDTHKVVAFIQSGRNSTSQFYDLISEQTEVAHILTFLKELFLNALISSRNYAL